MLAAGSSERDAHIYLSRLDEQVPTREIEIGCINSQRSIILTGKVEQLEILKKLLHNDLVSTRRLQVPVAYHS